MWGDSFNTVGDSFSTVGDSFSTVGIPSVLWRLFSTVGDTSVQWGIHQYSGEITSVQWGDNISTVEGIQYSGRRILISACSGH